MLHRTGLWTEAQVRGSKATERLSNKKIQHSPTHTKYQAHPLTKDLYLCQQLSSMKHMIMGGITTYIYAARYRKHHIAEQLRILHAGAGVDFQNRNAFTPLM